MSTPLLITDSGRPRFGVFDDAVDVNIAAYQHRTPLLHVQAGGGGGVAGAVVERGGVSAV